MSTDRFEIALERNPDSDVLEALASIYGARCYTKDGRVNVFDKRYRGGGGHFSRNAEWFAGNLGEGSRLLLVRDTQNGRKVSGYGLFYVTPKTFPSFADDAKWPTGIEAIGQNLAYTYLFIIEEEHIDQGLGWRLMSAIRGESRETGCRAIIHEFYVRPILNEASLRIHRKMGDEWGAIDTGRTAMHLPPGSDVPVVYAQHLIPTRDGERLRIDDHGIITFE